MKGRLQDTTRPPASSNDFNDLMGIPGAASELSAPNGPGKPTESRVGWGGWWWMMVDGDLVESFSGGIPELDRKL